MRMNDLCNIEACNVGMIHTDGIAFCQDTFQIGSKLLSMLESEHQSNSCQINYTHL